MEDTSTVKPIDSGDAGELHVIAPREDLDEKPIVDTIENPIETEEKEDKEDKEKEEGSDLVKEAMEANKRLKEELEDLKTRNTNVFEENEVLKVELEEQKKIEAMAKENAEIKSQLDAIKRNTIVENLMASGRINDSLRTWAEGMSYEQLEEFSKHAPKIKTVLDEKNSNAFVGEEFVDEEFAEWQKKVSKSRIIS